MHNFEQIIGEMPLLLNKLNNSLIFRKDEIGMGHVIVPRMGIYVPHENNRPIYVGRSNNIKQRLSGHGSQSSDRFSATFAFRLAIKAYEGRFQKSAKGIRRKDLEKDTNFIIMFREAKTRVAEMGIKAIEIDDQITQTIFEVYAAIKLETLEFNSFDNH